MGNPGLIRALCLFVPASLTAILWMWRSPHPREALSAWLAFAWNVPALLLVQALAQRYHWWHFAAQGGLVLGMPADLLFGWSLLWGALPVLAFPHGRWWLVTAGCAYADLLLMPWCAPVVQLGPHWLMGEVCALSLALLPALGLAHATRAQSHLPLRAFLIALCFGGLALGVLPTVALEQTGGSWSRLMNPPLWVLPLLLFPVLLGASAVQEFAERGQGTPLPFDPPHQLVTSGVYAYLRSPMQLACVLLVAGWAALLKSGWVATGALVAIAYSAGLASWSEDQELTERFGPAAEQYRQYVRRWWPRWHPWGGTSPSPARLLVGNNGLYAQIANYLPPSTGLLVMRAEQHDLTYDPGDGSGPVHNLIALTRAIEHLHFGWATLGWTLRLLTWSR